MGKEFLEYIVQVITHRLFILSVIVFIMFSILIKNIYSHQIIHGKEYLNKFVSETIYREREIPSTRGNIYDRNGLPLAINELAYSVLIDDSHQVDDIDQMIIDLIKTIEDNGDKVINKFPIVLNETNEFVFNSSTSITNFKKTIFKKEAKTLDEEQEKMNAKKLFNHIKDKLFKIDGEKYTDEEILKIMNIRFMFYENRYAKYRYLTLANKISEKTLAAIKENNTKFPGVIIIQDPIRKYPDAKYTSHIVGFTGMITASQYKKYKEENSNVSRKDIVGRSGLESKMEQYLRGEKGVEKLYVNNLGRILEVSERKEPKSGNDIYLTIDKKLQKVAYDALEKELTNILLKNMSEGKVSTRQIITSLISNNIISMKKISEAEDSDLQKNIYQKFLTRKKSTIDQIKDQIINKDIAVKNLSNQMEKYEKIIYESLVYGDNNIILLDKIDKQKDETYQLFRKKRISLKAFLQYAIKSNFINLEQIGLKDKKYKQDKVYTALANYIINNLDTNYYFAIQVYSEMVKYGDISLSDWCLVLYDQEVLAYNKDRVRRLSQRRLSASEFLRQVINNHELTPAQIGVEPYEGSVVVNDVKTGELLALVSYPSYDNNRISNGDNDYYSQLLMNTATKPLLHRALTRRTAPGSTYKMLTGIAGLSEGVIGPNEYIYANGAFTRAKPRTACWIAKKGGKHGNVNITSALAGSCNVYFCDVGYRLCFDKNGFSTDLGVDRLRKYASMFGLDSKTGIELDEYKPKIAVDNPVQAAIGQATNEYAPIHISRYVTAIASKGNVYNMHLVDKVSTKSNKVLLDKKTEIQKIAKISDLVWKYIYKGMYSVTNGPGGTAVSILGKTADFPLEVAGKSGTAQESKDKFDHSWFVGFAPYNDPQISVTVTIPHGITGSNSAKVMKEVYKSYFNIKGESEESTLTEQTLQTQ